MIEFGKGVPRPQSIQAFNAESYWQQWHALNPEWEVQYEETLAKAKKQEYHDKVNHAYAEQKQHLREKQCKR
jgi:hypothetical protein